jgi:hypothetical protein
LLEAHCSRCCLQHRFQVAGGDRVARGVVVCVKTGLSMQWPPCPPGDLARRFDQLHQARGDIRSRERNLRMNQENFLSAISSQLQPEAGMRGGQWNRHAEVSAALVREIANERDDTRRILDTLRHGVRLHFCEPQHSRKVQGPLQTGRCVSTCMSPDKVAIMPCARFRPVWLQNPSSEYRIKCIS